MVKHTLFLVHGMGEHAGTDWSKEVWDKLVECSKRYPHFQEHPLDDYAEPCAVEYDSLIRGALARWDQQATDFGEFAKKSQQKIPGAGSLEWLSGVSADDAGFVCSHVADALVYRFFANEAGQIRANVQLAIFEQIHEKRSGENGASARFSVMAHSLGTAVAHDALAALGGSDRIENRTNTFSAKNFRFDSIHMLSNVSRLLQRDVDPYTSVVRPCADNAPGSYCDQMYCYRHTLDPFCRPRPYEPTHLGSGFHLEEVDHCRGWNLHGWLHYLDHPRVHIPVLRSISDPSYIGRKLRKKAKREYPKYGGELENVAEARTKLEELRTTVGRIERDNGLRENLTCLLDAFRTVKELKDMAGATWAKLEGSVA